MNNNNSIASKATSLSKLNCEDKLISIHDILSGKLIDRTIAARLFEGGKNKLVIFRYFTLPFINEKEDYNFIKLSAKGLDDNTVYYFYFKVVKIFKYKVIVDKKNIKTVYKILAYYVGMYNSSAQLPFNSNSFEIYQSKGRPPCLFENVENYKRYFKQNELLIDDNILPEKKIGYLSFAKKILVEKLFKPDENLIFISSNINKMFKERNDERMITIKDNIYQFSKKGGKDEDRKFKVKIYTECWICLNVINNEYLVMEQGECSETFFFKEDVVREIYDTYDIGFKKCEVIF